LREGFFSRRSNLTTIATSARIKIASFLAMTAILLESVNGSVVEDHFNALIDLKKIAVISTEAQRNGEIFELC